MALSGLFLSSFLVIHLYINLFLFKQDLGHEFDAYAEFMATYPLLRPLEIILFAGFLLHAFIGIWLWLMNRRARPVRYTLHKTGQTSELSSRIMWLTGFVIAALLVVHIKGFFIASRFITPDRSMYDIVAEAFKNPWTDALYIVALFFLGYHLRHGFQSSFQTFGLRHERYRRLGLRGRPDGALGRQDPVALGRGAGDAAYDLALPCRIPGVFGTPIADAR